MSTPEEFSMEIDEPGEQPAAPEDAQATPDAADAADGGSSIVDGFLSTEPDIDASDAGSLFDTEEPWTAHAEVFARKFMYAYGLDGNPAVVHLLVAIVSIANQVSEQAEESEDDGNTLSEDPDMPDLPE